MPIALAILVIAIVGVIAVKQISNRTPSGGREITQLSNEKVNIISASSADLSSSIGASDVPPASTSSIQTPGSSPGEASSSPLQSNTNVNDPSVAGSPLVQSLFTGSQ